MSSSSRKVGLTKRLSIAVKSAAIGTAAAIVTPILLYRRGIKHAQSGRLNVSLDWDRIAKTVNSSGVLGMILSDMVDMLPGRFQDLWEDDEDEDFQKGQTVH